jgi:hypothetical protein
MEVVNDSIRYLVTKYYFNERQYTTNTVAQQQFYNLPPQVKKLINVTITIGSVVWQPKECPSRQYWDSLNVITFYQDFPSFFFVFNGQVGIYPIPSSAGNVITLNYKTRIPELSMADVTDVSSGVTMSLANGATGASSTTTGATGAFSNWMAGEWMKIPHSASATAGKDGDNQWYQIDLIHSATAAALKNPYTGSTVTGAAFTIGETPILPEDYQDLPLYRLGIIYYTTRFPDPAKAGQYQSLWDQGVKALDDEFGSKTTNVVLTDTDAQIVNPNLFVRSTSQNP